MRTKVLFTLLALMSVTLISCDREEDAVLDIPVGEMTFYASFGDAQQTKTTIKNESEVWWSPNDAINVFYGNLTSGKFTAMNAEEASTTCFTGSLSMATGTIETQNDPQSFWAVYPYDDRNTCDGHSVTLTVPAKQKGEAESFATKTFPAIATSSGLDLSFYNVCGGLAFSVTRDDIRTVTLHGHSNEIIAGLIQVGFSDGVPAILKEINGERSITLTAPSGQPFTPGIKFFITTLPTSFSQGCSLTFITTAGEVGVKEVGAEKQINRSRFLLMNDADAGVVFEPGQSNPNNIQFADAKIKERLVALFDTDNDGELSYSEAAAVTGIEGVFGADKDYTSFDEFQYFVGVSTIPDNMFKQWTNLASIILPESITKIGDNAFEQCEKLSELSLPNGLQSTGNLAFGYTGITHIIVPNTVTNLGYRAFYGCDKLQSAILPNSITYLNPSIFYNCKSLVSVEIPSSIIYIQASVFEGCTSLSSISIPKGVKSLGYNAFKDCSGLNSITIHAKAVPNGGSNMFSNTNNCPIYVPIESIESYKAAEYWSNYSFRIQAIQPEAVNLGLSVDWASFNVGATVSKEYGDYFAWGETMPYYEDQDPMIWKVDRSGYDWASYSWYDGKEERLTKYNTMQDYGFVDNLINLDIEDDAAHYSFGGDWRLPSISEWEELIEQCIWTWTNQDDVNGYLVESNNGNSIFIPAAGYRSTTSLSSIGTFGGYWSHFLNDENPYESQCMSFNSSLPSINHYARYYGFSIRPVTGKYVKVDGVSLDIDSINMLPGEIVRLTASVIPSNATEKSLLWSSSNTSVAIVEKGVVSALSEGSSTITVKTLDGSYSKTCQVTVSSFEFVAIDLGLSVRWANANLGARNIWECGDYYAWGDTEPNYENSTSSSRVWRPGKTGYNWESYKLCNGSYNSLTKYNSDSSLGIVDNKTVLELSDDAAYVNLGQNWRMPTSGEWAELKTDCKWEWTYMKGVNGYKVTSKKEGYEGAWIFLPTTGWWESTSLKQATRDGVYWSSSLHYSSPLYGAWEWFWINSLGAFNNNLNRSRGFAVRPVSE